MATNVHGAPSRTRLSSGGAIRRSVRRSLRESTGRLKPSVVYAVLTGAILVAYAAAAVGLRVVLPEDLPYAVALLATGAGALLALPLRDRLQRIVDRLVYGDRNEPDRALTRLGTQLEASIEPEAVPAVVVRTVAAALHLPYVAIELHEAGGPIAEHGEIPRDAGPGDLLRLELVHRGASVGWLVLAPRSPRERLAEADLRLLADLARHAGPALEAARLTADLRGSRLRLVTAREEERRRLRRDLHDGLGPTLAGTLLTMEAARATLPANPRDASRVLSELATGTRRAIEEVRRLTYDLRPPALDELGLVGALRERAASFAGGPAGVLRFDIHVGRDLSDLPAAVEVAAYRIVVEAMTNVVRHSGAQQATIDIAGSRRELVVEVRDDGRGIRGARHGVGLRSMRERAEELGGSLEVGGEDAGGTIVRARLPLHEAA
ncbi:MAG TPA: sensor histidine kinase [Candidatus Limnocylindria bacterium]|nr:sensor histidine kinase [Candidatus Limnocylindria bacterium]